MCVPRVASSRRLRSCFPARIERSGRWSASSRGNSELQKVLTQIARQIGLRRLIIEYSAELLARAKDLPPLMQSPAPIRRGQIEQLERAIERALETVLATLRVRANGAIDLTADIPQLGHQRQRAPSSAGKRGVCEGLCHPR
jgi:hypothetical protein